jgi:hypothetical protein
VRVALIAALLAKLMTGQLLLLLQLLLLWSFNGRMFHYSNSSSSSSW